MQQLFDRQLDVFSENWPKLNGCRDFLSQCQNEWLKEIEEMIDEMWYEGGDNYDFGFNSALTTFADKLKKRYSNSCEKGIEKKNA